MINFSSIKSKNLKINGNKVYLIMLNELNISDKYVSWLNDKEVNKFSSRNGKTFTPNEISNYVLNCNESDTKLLLGIYDTVLNIHIGNILLKADYGKSCINISNLIGEKDYWSKGYIVDANKYLMHFCFNYLKAKKFSMGNFSKNRASTLKSSSLGAKIINIKENINSKFDFDKKIINFELIQKDFYYNFPELKNTENWLF